MRNAILLLLAIPFTARSAHAQDERRGLHELELVGLEYGTVDLKATAGTVTSIGWDGRVRVTPRLVTVGAVRVAGYLGVELGYAKISWPLSSATAGKTRLTSQFELGLGGSWHARRGVDLAAHVYWQIRWDDNYTGPTIGSTDFLMLRLSGRRRNLLAQVALPVHRLANTYSSMFDASLWRLTERWSLGVRLQQFHSLRDYLAVGNRPTMHLISFMIGIVE
jgi:hypothetical protein